MYKFMKVKMMTKFKKFAVILAVGFVVSIVSGFLLYEVVADDVRSKLENNYD